MAFKWRRVHTCHSGLFELDPAQLTASAQHDVHEHAVATIVEGERLVAPNSKASLGFLIASRKP
jgi:hypothetical protein